MSTPNDPQKYLDGIEERIDQDPFYPYVLAVESASEQIDRALDPLSPSSGSLEEAVARAKAEIRALSGE